MAKDTKHKQIVLDYVTESNIEIIIRNSVRSLIQSNKVPDNPFGAMFRHFTYFSGKEDLRKSQEVVKGTEFKELDQASLFSITNQKSELDCFGLAHLLHYINVDHFKVLYKSLKDLCVEQKRKYEAGPYTLEVRTSIGGGEIFKSPLVPHPEVSSTPLEIRAECIVEGPKFETAFTLFSDYVYDDIMRIGSNNALNLVRDFNVEQGPGSSHVKRLTLESMQHNKQLLINELKNATIQKRNSYIRVLVFSQDLERYSSKDLIRAVTPSRLLSLTEPSLLRSTMSCTLLLLAIRLIFSLLASYPAWLCTQACSRTLTRLNIMRKFFVWRTRVLMIFKLLKYFLRIKGKKLESIIKMGNCIKWLGRCWLWL